MWKIPKTRELFSPDSDISKDLLEVCEYPHEAIDKLGDYIKAIISRLDSGYTEQSPGVFVADGAKIWDGATICGPTVIGRGVEIRPGAFIRGNVIVEKGALIGNSCEIKNSIIMPFAKLPHYNYAGDCIVGSHAHLGAGAIISNLRLDKTEIKLISHGESISTGRKKLGAMIGDYAEIGCGCVLCPGAIIGRRSAVYPLTTVKGYLPQNVVYDGSVMKAIN